MVDSRDADSGQAVRRRRECTACGQRYTTFERMEGVPLIVAKRDGRREPFDRAKVIAGVGKACKNRPVHDDTMLRLCDEVEEALRVKGAEVTAEQVGHEVLSRLRGIDEVAFVRFASVYREFEDVAEFERVIAELDPPNRRPIQADRIDVGGRG